MILVAMETPGVNLLSRLPVFGYDDAPNGTGELLFENVRVPAANLLLGEGRGFEIAQGRLGPGRVHHCMRAIGQAERTVEKMCARVKSRVTFGKPIAYTMDLAGNKAARAEIAMIKVAVPNMLCRVVDMAIQAHGAAGVSDDFGLAKAYADGRSLRIADGPDEVHRNQIGRLELEKRG